MAPKNQIVVHHALRNSKWFNGARRLGFVGLACVAACVARRAGAETVGIELTWDAPAGCATRADVEADIASVLAGPPSIRLLAKAHVTREAENAWALELVTQAGAGVRRREMRATTCAELSAAAATVLALEAGGASSPAPASRTPPGPATSPTSPPRQSAAPPVVEPRAEVTATPPERVFGFGASGATCTGAIGGVALGIAATAAWMPSRERIELQATYFPSAHVDRPELDIGGDFQLVLGGLAACHMFSSGALGIGPCLGGEAGRVGAIGTGRAVDLPNSRGRPWLAAKASGLALVKFGRIGLRGEVDAIVPILRESFVIHGVDEVYRPAPVSGRIILGAEVYFP